MATVRVELDSAAIRQFLLTEPGIEKLLAEKAQAVVNAAGSGVQSRVYRGRDRLRAQVWTATRRAKLNEANHRSLTRALDAARD